MEYKDTLWCTFQVDPQLIDRVRVGVKHLATEPYQLSRYTPRRWVISRQTNKRDRRNVTSQEDRYKGVVWRLQ